MLHTNLYTVTNLHTISLNLSLSKINVGLFDFGKKKIKQLEGEVQQLKRLAFDERGFQNTLLQNIANINRNIAIYPSYDLRQNSDRYITTDDVYSIVRLLAQTAAMVKLYAYEVKSDTAAKQLHRLSRPHDSPLQTKALQLKALVDLPDTDPLFKLLEHPSDIFSKFEFFEAIYTSLFNDGNALLYKERPEEGTNEGKPVNLLFLHPQCITLKVTDSLPRRIVAYDYNVNGNVIYENIPVEDVIHIRYFNPDISVDGNELWGLSPLRVLAKRLTQLDGITDVTTAQMQNGGVNTIVFDKTIDGSNVEVIGQRKDNFHKFLKNPGNAGAPYFASGEMGSVQLGSNMRDLKVLEASNVTFKKLCNAYGTSVILFNSEEAATESNVKEMTKRMYTNTILPNVYRVRDALIKGLLPDFADGKKRDIREDISEITELQPNMKEMAEVLQIAWWIPRNEALEMMRFERNANPLFDEPLIPTGYQTPDELGMVEPIDTDITEGNLANGK